MPEVTRILIVEDLPTDAELNEREVRAVLPQSEFVRVDSRDAFLAALAAFRPDLILSDYRMPQFDGLSALQLTLARAPETPFIIVTGSTNEDTAVECMKAGAWDYVIKEHVKRLGPAVESALAQRLVRQERRRAEAALRESNRDLQFLYELSNALSAAPCAVGLEECVAKALAGYLGAKVVLVARHLPDRHTLEVQHVEADSQVLQAVASILETGVLGFTTAVDESVCDRLLRRRVEILRDVHEASLGAVPRAVSAGLHQALGLGEIVALALVHRDRLWGTVMSVLPDGAARPDEKTLRTASEVIAQAMERRDGEVALRESKDLVDAVVENVPLMIFLKEAEDLRFVVFNRAGEELLGYERKDLLGKNDLDLFPPEQAAFFMRNDREALAGETLVDIPEEPIQTAKQGLRLLHTRKVCIKGADGVTRYLLGISEDITERKRLEASLRKSEEQFRVAQELSPDGFTILRPIRDAEGRVVDFTWVYENAAVARLNGTDPKAVVGQRLLDLFPGHRGSLFLSAYQHVAESGEHRVFEAEFARAGAAGPLSLRIVVVPMGGDIAVLAQDVTERRRAEADRERLTTAMEQADESVLITDAQGSITYVNPAFEAVSGYTRAELLGRNPRMLKSGVQDEAFYRAFWETISSGKTWHGRFVNRKKDGTKYTEDATVSPVRDAAGNIASFVAVKRDVTRDLDLEAQLLQSQKMEGIGRLAGGVAHDFNNLLSVILSYAGFALDSVPEGSTLSDDILEIQRAGERAASLTRQLLAFSRKQVLQPVSLDLNRVLEDMEKMLRWILGEDIDLTQALAPDLGRVKADPGQVEQVLLNLAVNARDAMAEGGMLTIETANVTLDAEYAAAHPGVVPGPHVMVAVSDSGMGMNAETMAKIFEPFFTTKGPGKGTGLGLSTVFGIVKQSGGTVHVYSEVGEGTTFKVYLPRELAAATAPAPARPVASRSVTGAQTILVVEDEVALRRVARRTLEAAGYTVLVAANGEEALQASAQYVGEIHLLLTDVVMPRMGGRLLAEELTRTRPALKVLYMSGYTDNAIVHHGVLDAGMQFLAKPFTADDLAQKVHEVLAGGSTGLARRHGAAVTPDAETEGHGLADDALRALPEDLLERLRAALIGAHHDEIVALVETVRAAHPQVAAALRRMADRRDYAGLRDLLGPRTS